MNSQILKNLTDGQFEFVEWCSFCSAEPAHGKVTMTLDKEPQDFPIGLNCLNKANKAGRVEGLDTPSDD